MDVDRMRPTKHTVDDGAMRMRDVFQACVFCRPGSGRRSGYTLDGRVSESWKDGSDVFAYGNVEPLAALDRRQDRRDVPNPALLVRMREENNARLRFLSRDEATIPISTRLRCQYLCGDALEGTILSRVETTSN